MSNERWLRDIPSSISEGDLQDLVDVAFGAAEYINSTFRKGAGPYVSGRRVYNVSAVRNIPYEPSLKSFCRAARERAATWRFARVFTSPNGGWGNATVVKDVEGALSLGTLLKRKGASSHLTLSRTAPSRKCSASDSPHWDRRAAIGAYGMKAWTRRPIKVGRECGRGACRIGGGPVYVHRGVEDFD